MALHTPIQKSRGGCLTCKRRRVKCDEGKPVCDRCQRAGMFCEGYSLFVAAESGCASQPKVTPLGEALTPFRLSPHEVKAYSAYRHQAVLFGGPSESAFWNELVLRIAAADEAIRQCIFAVGSIIRHVQKHGLMYDIKVCRCNDCRFAVLSYNRAIKEVVECKISSGKTDVAALACAMFVSLEMLQGNDDRVLDLVEKGHSVMCQENMNISVAAKSPSSLVSALWPVFGRLRVLVQLSGRPLLPLQNDGIQFARLVSTFDRLRGKLHELQGNLHPYLIATTLARWSNYADCDVVDLYSQHSKHQSALTAWFEMFKEWSSKSPQTSDVEERFAIPLLKASYLTTSIWFSTALCPSKTRFSNHYDSFAQVLDLAALGLEQSEQDVTSFPFEFETGFLPLLFFTATRCRDIVLRRRAMDLLARTKLREGTWDRAEVIAVTKRFVQLEALGGIDTISTTQSIHLNEHPTYFDDVHIGKRYTSQGKLATTVTYYWLDDSLALCSKKENIQIST